MDDCALKAKGLAQGACSVETDEGILTACRATLRQRNGTLERRITSIHLSRPENYLSIYQSGCNLSCRKCHSSEFTRHAQGTWLSPRELAAAVREYKALVNLREPRERATTYHAQDTCRCCGRCVVTGERSPGCPGTLEREKVLLSPQGFGPARNIVAFTGGDLLCRPDFFAECARGIKEETGLWILLETNGYGLTGANLDLLKDAGVDAFWLDIKAFDPAHHRELTGVDNERILGLPGEMLSRGFVLEVLSLCIPGLVEAGELGEIAALLASVDPEIPFTILAFFPAYRMEDVRSPTADEMASAYEICRDRGLRKIRLGNLGVFVRTPADLKMLRERVGEDAL
jgi:pyruvate-formate lyase-activating enzyme